MQMLMRMPTQTSWVVVVGGVAQLWGGDSFQDVAAIEASLVTTVLQRYTEQGRIAKIHVQKEYQMAAGREG
jgi:hypothetical protein